MSEATEFHPLVSSSFDAAVKHELYIFSMMFEIGQISATLCSKYGALFVIHKHFKILFSSKF